MLDYGEGTSVRQLELRQAGTEAAGMAFVAAHLVSLVGHYGYALVALFLFAEGLAIPLPTATTVVTASALAARGHLALALVFVVATVSTSAGTTAAFFVGRSGSTFLERHAHGGARALQRAHSFFARHGPSAILFGRFIPVVRMFVSFVAGVSEMDARRFALFNVAGAAIWAAAFCAIGYFFGHHPGAFYHQLVRATLVTGLGLGALMTIVVAGGWLVEDADAAWRVEGTLWHRLLMSPPVRWLARHSPRAQAILFRRFSPADYLGLNLTLGLGLSFVLLLLFVAIAQGVLSSDAIARFDLELARALREEAAPGALAFWSAVSRLGTLPATAGLGLAAALLFARKHGRLPLIGCVAALAGGELLSVALKHAVHRDAALTFPSGHVVGAVVGYGMIAYFAVLSAASRLTRVLALVAATAIVLAIGFSRLYLGVHVFSDVIGGLAAGAVWLTACLTGLEVARRKAAADRIGAAARREEKVGGPPP